MKKFAGALVAVLGFTIKLILLFTAIIIGMDLANRYIEDHSSGKIDAEQ